MTHHSQFFCCLAIASTLALATSLSLARALQRQARDQSPPHSQPEAGHGNPWCVPAHAGERDNCQARHCRSLELASWGLRWRVHGKRVKPVLSKV
eukprot:scaffold567_cov384-Prasinococcus_capsulatus_cf.AAC.16